jgi:hypothetical protein
MISLSDSALAGDSALGTAELSAPPIRGAAFHHSGEIEGKKRR